MSAAPQAPVTLREITADTVRPIVRLKVRPDQEGFVAPNAVSLAQALFAEEAWYRAIYVGDEPAGFVMVYDETLRKDPPAEPRAGLWRFMVDARYQRGGVGREALRQVIEHVRAKNRFDVFETSFVPGPGCPEPFYLGMGFRHTGREDEGEKVLELPLTREVQAPRTRTPAQAAQEQLDAYNAHDLARYVAVFAEDVVTWRLPASEPATRGRDALADFYGTHRFNVPALRAELLGRMVVGNKVIDHERIHGLREQPFEMAAAYEVVDGLIVQAWFLSGA